MSVVYTTASHYIGLWRMNTEEVEVVETDHMVTTIAVVPLSKDTSFCVTISENNNVSIYLLESKLDLMSTSFIGVHHEFCPPTRSLVTGNTLYLAGAYLSKWRCEDGSNDGLTAHKTPIVAVFTNDLFHRVLSIDQSGDLVGWETTTGYRCFAARVCEPGTTVSCMRVDPLGRRILIGYSSGLLQIVAGNSGMVLATIDATYCPGGCQSATFGVILKSKRILCSSAHRVVLFEDISGNRWSFLRNFLGHTEEIQRAMILKERHVLSVGESKEVFLWNVTQQYPIMRYQLPTDPTCVSDLSDDSSRFLIGDIDGRLHFMKIDCPTPISTFQGIDLTIRSAVSTVTLTPEFLIVGNMHGYVKIWKRKGSRVEEIRRFRAHLDGVTAVAYSADSQVLVTSGMDEEIRVWGMGNFEMVGELGKIWKWRLEETSTWRPKDAPSDDPNHFLPPEENILDQATESRKTEEANKARSVPETPELPPFSFETFRLGMEELEQLCATSRAIEKIVTTRPDDLPQTARVVYPPGLIPLLDRDMTRTNVTKPKIWKPKA
jgi:WD40 repeat protein